MNDQSIRWIKKIEAAKAKRMLLVSKKMEEKMTDILKKKYW